MSNNLRTYNAIRVEQRKNGIYLPTIKEITENVLKDKGTVLKLEEITKQVSQIINFPRDDSIIGAVSSALKELKKEGIADHVKHAHWQLKQNNIQP